MTKIPIQITYTEQEIANSSFDEGLGLIVTELSDHSGNLINPATEETSAGLFAKKITSPDANTTYIAIAPIGSSQSAAVWQVKKILVSGNDTIITWAGNGLFNQIATDLTTLTYL